MLTNALLHPKTNNKHPTCGVRKDAQHGAPSDLFPFILSFMSRRSNNQSRIVASIIIQSPTYRDLSESISRRDYAARKRSENAAAAADRQTEREGERKVTV